MKRSTKLFYGLSLTLLVFSSCSNDPAQDSVALTPEENRFTIAVIPDTQNMTDFTHQTTYEVKEGVKFPIDAGNQFYTMMEYIAANSVTNGGKIVFAASVGDVWQHQTEIIDTEHASRGFSHDPKTIIANSGEVFPTSETTTFEMPLARKGYELIANTGMPFGVAPGNHDSDSMWSEASFASDPSRLAELYTLGAIPEILGMLHIGGHKNFNSVFGENTSFFKGKPWYISSFNGGANSAQRFTAAGYTFININFEMQPGNDVLAWAQKVINDNPGVPTMITTHDFLKENGKREANPIIDLVRIDPEKHNSADQVFEKFIMPNDQIFLVLCGHHHGKAMRVDTNNKGNKIYQVLADYQDRGQTVLDANASFTNPRGSKYGIGDGWLRLMNFDFNDANPKIIVKTYSSHYKKYSDDVLDYTKWYKADENPTVSDSEFYNLDSFTIDLNDFKARFKKN